MFYRYDPGGRLKQYTRTLYGYRVKSAEYTRFGEQVKLVTSDEEELTTEPH